MLSMIRSSQGGSIMLDKRKQQAVNTTTQQQAEISDRQLDGVAGGAEIARTAGTAPVERDEPAPVLMVISNQDF